jgi:hypothetical protein
MEIQSLEGFDFVDCYFHGFSVHPLLSSVTLKTEAYFPQLPSESERKVGILSIALNEVTEMHTEIRPPFSYDLEANEVYELTLTLNNGVYEFYLNSDYLALTVMCKQARLEQSE